MNNTKTTRKVGSDDDRRIVRMPDEVFSLLGTAVTLNERGDFINNCFAKEAEGMILGKAFEETANKYASLINSGYQDDFWHFVDIKDSNTLYIYPQKNDVIFELSHGYAVDNKTFGVLCTIASLDRCAVLPDIKKLTANSFSFKRERLELAIFRLTEHLLSVEQSEKNREAIIDFQETINYYGS